MEKIQILVLGVSVILLAVCILIQEQKIKKLIKDKKEGK